MKKRQPATSLIVYTFILVVLNACSDFKKGEGSLLYKIHVDNIGPTIKVDDFIGFEVTEKTEEDSILYNSYDYNRPSFMYCGHSMFNGDFTSALSLLSEGDSATIKISLDSMVKAGKPRPDTKRKYLIYDIKITNVLSRNKISDSLFYMEVDNFICGQGQKYKDIEIAEIDQFTRENHLTPAITGSGLIYQIIKKGVGPQFRPGDSVDIQFVAKLLNGKIIDGSYPEYAQELANYIPEIVNNKIRWSEGIGSRFFMPGFNEAVILFPVGTKVKLIVPSTLVSNDQEGRKGIPPYVPVLVDLEIVEIIPRKNL